MRDLYIVGAGGFGREVYAWLCDEQKILNEHTFQGFLDDNLEALDGFNHVGKVVGSISGFSHFKDTSFICGIGAVEPKRKVCAPMIENGARFLQMIHPSVIIGENVILGEGVVLCPRVTLTCDIVVGSMAMVNCHSSAGHDARIGAWSTVSAHCDLTGATEIGEGAFLGSGVSIIPRKKVGMNAVVGAGSVVIKNVPDSARVFGNPAREF